MESVWIIQLQHIYSPIIHDATQAETGSLLCNLKMIGRR